MSSYPDLDQWAAAGLAALPERTRRANPLWKLTVGTNQHALERARRTNESFRVIGQRFPTWLFAKTKQLTDPSTKPRDVTGILGEIRALAHVSTVWPNAKPRSSGADFETPIEDDIVLIEVTTPSGATKNTRLPIDNYHRSWIRMKITSVMPFRRPQRPTKDNVQGEATSWLAGLKKEEHQFSENQVGILWIDFQDEDLSLIATPESLGVPIGQFREDLTSGPLWMAWYGQKNDPVYANYPANPLPTHEPVYHMEFDGRFGKPSKIDFVIADFGTTQIVLGNPRTRKSGAAHLPQYFYRLPGFSPELSWLDWPAPNTLARRIKDTRKNLIAYEGAFPAPDDPRARDRGLFMTTTPLRRLMLVTLATLGVLTLFLAIAHFGSRHRQKR